jgi:TonB-linked SusC/RagA family outer membrane protein
MQKTSTNQRISPKKHLLALCLPMLICFLTINFAIAQDKLVKGKITSADGAGIPGVNVLVKGTNKGTNSDTDGNYSIDASANTTLVFSFVGYVTQEVAVNNQSEVNVTLIEDTKQLGEVVVTALGIRKEARAIGYSTQDVKGEDLIKAREPNALNNLVGRVAGLTVGPSSEMLRAPQLVLRGESQLLIVIDGVPVVTDSWNISADDIDTYTVLKGPNAAALYGSRGRNGAILITTKRGSKDKRGFSIDVNSSTMIDKGFLTIPKVQEEYGPGEYNTYRFGDDDFGQANGYNQNDYDVWGPKFNGQLISQYDSPINPTTGIRSATPWIARGKNNLQRFLQTGILSTNNIAIGSSGEKYDVRASISNSYQRGIVPNTNLDIINFNLSFGYNFTPKLRIESNLNYNRQFTKNFPDVNYGPNSIIYNIDVWAGADWDINDLKDYWQPGKVGVQQRNFEYVRYNNPWFMSYEWLRGHYKTDTYGYVSLKYKLTDWLSIAARTQITSWDLLRTEKFPYSASAYSRDQKRGDYREDKRSLFENNTDILVNINKQITPAFTVSGLVGGNLRTYNWNSSYSTTDYLSVNGVYNFSNSLNNVKTYNFTAPMQVGSGYYSFDFSYRNFLTLSTTGRYDKFSTFYNGYNGSFYPSVSLSTVVSDYIKMPDVISFVKLRSSYANVKNAFTSSTTGPAWSQLGSGNPLDYGDAYISAYDGPLYSSNTYNISKVYNGSSVAYYTQTLASNTLKPSANSSAEVGLDLKFLGNRLGFDVTYFDAIKGPGITTAQFSEASGFTGGVINGVKTEKKGWEISVSGTPIQNSNGLTWNVLANWSTYVERFKEFYDGKSTLNGRYLGGDSRIDYKIGDRVDGNYGYKFYRDANGNIIHKSNGDVYRDNLVAQYLGHYNPDWVWSLVNTFSYKGISFNFQFDGRVGGVGQDYVYKKLLQGGREISTVQGAYGAARLAEFNANPNNDNNKTPTPTYVGSGVALASDSPKPSVDPLTGQITNLSELKLVSNSTPYSLQDYIGSETKFDERVLISRTFAKLRQITISYNIPSSILGKSFIRQASVSLIARNVLYFGKRKDVDWDSFIGTNASSQDLKSPTLRRFGINLNLSF